MRQGFREIREAFIYGSKVAREAANPIEPYLKVLCRSSRCLLNGNATSGGDLSDELIEIHCVLFSRMWVNVLHSDAHLVALLLEAFLLDWKAASWENNVGVNCYGKVRTASQEVPVDLPKVCRSQYRSCSFELNLAI